MMIQILESGQALYALAAVCVLGILARLTARTLYRRLIRETDNMALTKNRYLRDFRQKAENTYRLNQGIANTQAYLEKQLNGYRFLGVSLNGWGNLAGQMTVLCFLLGGAGSFLAYWYRCDTYYIVLYATAGILAGLLTMFLDIGVNLPEKRSQLLSVLQDYLENSLCLRLARESAAALDYTGVRDRVPGNAVQEPRAVSRDSVGDGGRTDWLSRDSVRDGGRTDRFSSDGGKTADRLTSDGGSLPERDLRDGGETAGRDGSGREPSGTGGRGAIRSIARGSDREPDFGNEARSLNRSQRRGERAVRKNTLKPAGDAPAAERERPEEDVLRRSLEQIAASREKSRMDGEWLKELSPDELELVGQILKQYLA